jgi:hypothetical protein
LSARRVSIGPPPVFLDEGERRLKRAYDEYYRYQFRPVAREGRRWFDCENQESGETYEVTPFTCTCWDAVRAERLGVKCKHVLMLEIAVTRGDIRPPFPVIPGAVAG